MAEQGTAAAIRLNTIFKHGQKLVKVTALSRNHGVVAVDFRPVLKDGRLSAAEGWTTFQLTEKVNIINPEEPTGDSNSREGNTMPTVVKRSGAKKTTNAKKSTPKPAAAATTGRKPRRSAEEVDALVPAFVEHLTSGGTMRALKAEHGFSDDGPIRAALLRNGFDSKGNETEIAAIKSTGAALTKRLLAERNKGTAWYQLALATGKPEAELRKLVADAGGETGRIYIKGKKAAKPASTAKPAAKKTTAKKTVARKGSKDPSSQA